MYQPPVSLRPESTQDTLRPRRPPVERIAAWSSRHRKTAVFGWLLLVAALFMAATSVRSEPRDGRSPSRFASPRVPLGARFWCQASP